MAIMHLMYSLPLGLLLSSTALASPQPQDATSTVPCADACYSALAAKSASAYTCNVWEARYPPAIYTSTRLYIYTPTVLYHSYANTRTETRYALSAPSSPPTTAPTPTPTSAPLNRRHAAPNPPAALQPRQAPTTTTTTPGLPLPDPTLGSACSNNPTSFSSACACIGKTSYTIYTDAYATASATVTRTSSGYTCTSTSTVGGACAASTAFGLRPQALRWGDTGYEGYVAPVVVNGGNGTEGMTAEGCCRACFGSGENCRFFTYRGPGEQGGLGDGGVCELDLEGDTCPIHVFPSTSQSQVYNYITEGMYVSGDTNGTYYAFGPCAVEVPMFYGYQNGRGGNPESCVAGNVAPVSTYAL